MIRHIVLYKIKSDVSKEELDRLFHKFKEVKNHLKGISAFHLGPAWSPSEKNSGYNFALCIDVDSEKTLNEYSVHSIHQEFKKNIAHMLEMAPSFLTFDLMIK